MDSTVVVKLEDFGLGNLINDFRVYLCDKTVNQNNIAAALQFDDDQRAIINAPPDNFSRNEKLYELIQKRANVGKFLAALGETGNEHILKFIKEADLSAPLSSTSTNSNPSQRRGIRFNIPEPIDSFCGREDFLNQLHDRLKPRDDADTEVTVLSQVKIVSGLGGIGKTQTARKYITKYRKFYNNFIWVDAETENSMRNSFLKLAEKEIKIPLINFEGKSREIQEIVKEIYKKICDGGKSNLIVFDNAEDYLSCRQFFPFGLHPDLTKPVILATSRNQEWISTTGKIQVLPLDKMTDDESFDFIRKQLEIPESEIPGLKEESKEFIELIGGLPLALQQAVAYIKQQKKKNVPLGRPYKMSDYVKEFKSSAEKLQKFPHAPDSSTTIFITWNLTLEKIKEDPKGKTAIQIIEVMSFLYADKIPVKFLLQLLPLAPSNWINRFFNFFRQQQEDFKSTESDLAEGLNLLDKYSMIKIPGNFVSVHREVQFVGMQNLKGSGRLINFFNDLIKKCLVILKNIKLSECSDIFLNLHQIVNHSFDSIPVTNEFLDFMAEFGSVLHDASRYLESLELYKKVYSRRCELLGENHENTLSAQHGIALQLDYLRRYDEALTLYKEILKKQELHPNLGVDHPDTISTKYNIADILREQEKYGESLELLQQVLAQRNKILGENHPETLITQHQIARVHYDLGDFSHALVLYQDVEKKQTEVLGPEHRSVLNTKHNKAVVLYNMEKFKEASEIFNEVYEKYKEILGENHYETINTLRWIALILEGEGKFTQALQLYNTVYENYKTNFGKNHPDTIGVKDQIETFERKLREQNPPL